MVPQPGEIDRLNSLAQQTFGPNVNVANPRLFSDFVTQAAADFEEQRASLGQATGAGLPVTPGAMNVPSMPDPGTIGLPGISYQPLPAEREPQDMGLLATPSPMDLERRRLITQKYLESGLTPPTWASTDELEAIYALRTAPTPLPVEGQVGIPSVEERQAATRAGGWGRLGKFTLRLGEEPFAAFAAATGMGFWDEVPPEFLQAVEEERALGPMLGDIDPQMPAVRAMRRTSPFFTQMPIIGGVEGGMEPTWTLGGAEAGSEAFSPLNIPPLGAAKTVVRGAGAVRAATKAITKEAAQEAVGAAGRQVQQAGAAVRGSVERLRAEISPGAVTLPDRPLLPTPRQPSPTGRVVNLDSLAEGEVDTVLTTPGTRVSYETWGGRRITKVVGDDLSLQKEPYRGPQPGLTNTERMWRGEDIARGRAALVDRLRLEGNLGTPGIAGETDYAEAFIRALPDELLEDVGLSIRSQPDELAFLRGERVDDPRGLLGTYDPGLGLATLYRKVIDNSGYYADEVLIHELSHSLQRYVPPEDLALLRRQYQRELAAATSRRVSRGATVGVEPELGHRLSSFEEWFAEAITSRGMRDVAERTVPQGGVFTRTARRIREIAVGFYNWLRTIGRGDHAERVYRNLVLGRERQQLSPAISERLGFAAGPEPGAGAARGAGLGLPEGVPEAADEFTRGVIAEQKRILDEYQNALKTAAPDEVEGLRQRARTSLNELQASIRISGEPPTAPTQPAQLGLGGEPAVPFPERPLGEMVQAPLTPEAARLAEQGVEARARTAAVTGLPVTPEGVTPGTRGGLTGGLEVWVDPEAANKPFEAFLPGGTEYLQSPRLQHFNRLVSREIPAVKEWAKQSSDFIAAHEDAHGILGVDANRSSEGVKNYHTVVNRLISRRREIGYPHYEGKPPSVGDEKIGQRIYEDTFVNDVTRHSMHPGVMEPVTDLTEAWADAYALYRTQPEVFRTHFPSEYEAFVRSLNELPQPTTRTIDTRARFMPADYVPPVTELAPGEQLPRFGAVTEPLVTPRVVPEAAVPEAAAVPEVVGGIPERPRVATAFDTGIAAPEQLPPRVRGVQRAARNETVNANRNNLPPGTPPDVGAQQLGDAAEDAIANGHAVAEFLTSLVRTIPRTGRGIREAAIKAARSRGVAIGHRRGKAAEAAGGTPTEVAQAVRSGQAGQRAGRQFEALFEPVPGGRVVDGIETLRPREIAEITGLTAQDFHDLGHAIDARFPAVGKTSFANGDTKVGLQRLLTGDVPTPGQSALLRRVFGHEFVRAMRSRRPVHETIGQVAWELVGLLPRQLRSGFEVSAVMRQGAIYVVNPRSSRHKAARKAFAEAYNSLFFGLKGGIEAGERAAGQVVDEILDPNLNRWAEDLYDPTDANALFIHDVRPGGTLNFTQREETMLSNIIRDIPETTDAARAWLRSRGVAGRVVEPVFATAAIPVRLAARTGRAFEAAYATFLNRLRNDIAVNTLNDWQGAIDDAVRTGRQSELPYHLRPENAELEIKSLKDVVNTATGRGGATLPKFVQSGIPWLNAIWWAPRFVLSRIETPYLAARGAADVVLNRFGIDQAGAAARKDLAKDFTLWVATTFGILATLEKTGVVEVELDCRSSDFGKGKVVGTNTRFDFWAGMQPMVRYGCQLMSGERKELGTGEVKPIRGVGYGRLESPPQVRTVLDFMRSKAAPGLVTLAANELAGGTFGQQPLDQPVSLFGENIGPEVPVRVREAMEQVVSLFWLDVIESIETNGAGMSAMYGVPAFHGVGVQTFEVGDPLPPNVEETELGRFFRYGK